MSDDALKRVTSATVASPSVPSALRSRHSLYGTEDRVVLDLGSKIWKFGFSGEAQPRACFDVTALDDSDQSIWALDKHEIDERQWRAREERIKRALRSVYNDYLMIDGKSRKVILVDNPLWSAGVKQLVAQLLFDNLQVPALSFACNPVCSALSCAMVTGLVVDVGNLETVVTPVFHSRPLFTYISSTTRAGSRVTARLRSLLLQHGTHVAPPTSLSSSAIPQASRPPRNVLTERLCEDIKTRTCFVQDRHTQYHTDDLENDEELILQRMEEQFFRSTAATTLTFQVPGAPSQSSSSLGRGWLRVPGWVRERAAEVLFEDDFDEPSVTKAVLEVIQRVPIDLRRPMIENIIVTGGTAMLPGFCSRLHDELVRQLSISIPSPPPSPPIRSGPSFEKRNNNRHRDLASKLWSIRASPQFAALSPLAGSIRLVNARSTDSFAFEPSLAAWVGASLAGALKAGGSQELIKDQWDGVVPDWPDLYWSTT